VLFTATDNWNLPAVSQQVALISVCDQPCDDNDLCTDDTCPGGACQHQAASNPCPDDANPCTLDQCQGGVCYTFLADDSPCPDDGSVCTTDLCTAGVCLHQALPDGASCTDDGNACTLDACQSGWCRNDAFPDGTPCDDGVGCTSPDQCISGWCTGKVPLACIDDLECTSDWCDDPGPHFEASQAPFADIAGQGFDLGLDGDDLAAGPISIGFDYPFPLDAAPKTELWVSSNGLITFQAPSLSFKDSCGPSGDPPDDWVAPYWDDLVCLRSEGCTVHSLLRGQDPARELVIQWTGARVFESKSGRVTFQAILSEDGGLKFAYGDLSGQDGQGATIGIEGADGQTAASFSCGERGARPGLLLTYTAHPSRCRNDPWEGFCVIDGACLPEDTPNPSNPCQRCRAKYWPFGWTEEEGAWCDDGRACTVNDVCSQGICRGEAPAMCQDGLACTIDSCSDGGFVPGGGLFMDISATGIDTGIDGDEAVAGAFPLDFPFAFIDGSTQDIYWVGSNGFLSFMDPLGGAAGSCIPAQTPPNGLVAPFFADLACLASEGCSVKAQTFGEKPDHFLVVQWTGARLSGSLTPLTFQAVLFEGGAVEFRYPASIDPAGAWVAIGMENPSGTSGIQVQCGSEPVSAGSLRYDPQANAACTHRPEPSSCVIDGACWKDGDPSPKDPCQACRPEIDPGAWSSLDDVPCDDGDGCTTGDTCWAGVCQGVPYSCPSTSCLDSKGCDGTGGCLLRPYPAGTACGQASCRDGWLEQADVCDGAGECRDGGELPCWPFACADSTACDTRCLVDTDCQPGTWCDPEHQECSLVRSNGDGCQRDGQCAAGHCQNDRCCPQGDCCQRAEDCPEIYTLAAACDDPPRCQGHRGEIICTAWSQCDTHLVEDDSACTPEYRFTCRGVLQVCSGAVEQPVETCLQACQTSADCGATDECRQGVCQPRPLADGGDSDTGGGGCGCGSGPGAGTAAAPLLLGLLLGLARSRQRPGGTP